MTHREAFRAWGRSMVDWVNGILLAVALLAFFGLRVEAASVDLRWLVSTLAIVGISYRASYKTINADRQRCASDALVSSHDLRTAVALHELRKLYRAGRELQKRAGTPGATPPTQEELSGWDGRVRRELHERWAADMDSNYVEMAWIREGKPIYGPQLEWALHHIELLVESDGHGIR